MTSLKESLQLWLTLVATYTLMRVIPQNSYYLRTNAGRGGVANSFSYPFGRGNRVMRISAVSTYLSNRRVLIDDSRENTVRRVLVPLVWTKKLAKLKTALISFSLRYV